VLESWRRTTCGLNCGDPAPHACFSLCFGPLFRDEEARRDQLEPLAQLTAWVEKTVRLNPAATTPKSSCRHSPSRWRRPSRSATPRCSPPHKSLKIHRLLNPISRLHLALVFAHLAPVGTAPNLAQFRHAASVATLVRHRTPENRAVDGGVSPQTLRPQSQRQFSPPRPSTSCTNGRHRNVLNFE
jgi:hypothetical protein